jgi:UDP-2,3-diacylglucosamine hydrolase
MSIVAESLASPATNAPNAGTLGIVCGGGEFPIVVAEAAQKAGWSVVMFPLRGFAEPAVERFPHEWITLGKVGHFVARARARSCSDLVFLGTVIRPRWRDLSFDWTTVRLVPQIVRFYRGGDDLLLSAMAQFFEKEGFRVRGAHEVAPDILVPSGSFAGRRPRPADETDIARGLHVIRTLGSLDVGQAVVVAAGQVIAVEAAEGTDLMLARCRELRKLGRFSAPPGTGVLVKAAKPFQDRRLDLPSVGVRTVENVAAAGLAGIAVEAGGSIVSDLQAVIEAADSAGLFVVGIDPGGNA